MASAPAVAQTLPGAPGGFRAAQGPDTNVASEFLDLFGRAPRMEACECDRTSDTNMLQALHMINGDTLLKRIGNPGGRVIHLANDAKLTPTQRIEELYLAALSRAPTADELNLSVKYI